MATRENVKAIMKTTGQTLVYEDENSLEYENPCHGETINFEFENGILVRVYS